VFKFNTTAEDSSGRRIAGCDGEWVDDSPSKRLVKIPVTGSTSGVPSLIKAAWARSARPSRGGCGISTFRTAGPADVPSVGLKGKTVDEGLGDRRGLDGPTAAAICALRAI